MSGPFGIVHSLAIQLMTILFKKRIFLFIINGLGLGNAVRCHGIIQGLRAQGATVAIATANNGLWYFHHNTDWQSLHELDAFHYAANLQGKLSVAGTVKNFFKYSKILYKNVKSLRHLLTCVEPHVIVTDSDYSCTLVRHRGIPVVAINNANEVETLYHRFSDRPRSIRPHFWTIEHHDALFHRLIPDMTISPALESGQHQTHPRLHTVGPIVRRGLPCRVRRSGLHRVVVLLSGSAFASHIHFTLPHYPVAIDVIGRQTPKGVDPLPQGVVFHGKVADTRPLLQQADMLVVNGGFSAISEGFWLGIPMVVAPVAYHAEQWVNARLIQHLGVGTLVAEGNLEQALLASLDRVEHYRQSYEQLPIPDDGAAQATKLLMELAFSLPNP
ncbi:MAG TPA: hypothetical protein DCS88_04130 [Alphaproteobacteria bacterium]|nr:hypothetical protein [Alphaproteobacteria bacterium]